MCSQVCVSAVKQSEEADHNTRFRVNRRHDSLLLKAKENYYISVFGYFLYSPYQRLKNGYGGSVNTTNDLIIYSLKPHMNLSDFKRSGRSHYRAGFLKYHQYYEHFLIKEIA